MQPHDTTNVPRRVKDLTGQRFGCLVVVSFSHIDKYRYAVWNCLCDCGQQYQLNRPRLESGKVVSCGCVIREKKPRDLTTHGLAHHPLYQTYQSMMHRCYNPKRSAYPHYGGRGITVCDRWRESIQNFIDDVGPRPGPDYSLDRIDNDKQYEPGNVRWATRTEQHNNQRKNHLLTFQGKTMTVTEWSRVVGIGCYTIFRRLRAGWSTELALTQPVDPIENPERSKKRHSP